MRQFTNNELRDMFFVRTYLHRGNHLIGMRDRKAPKEAAARPVTITEAQRAALVAYRRNLAETTGFACGSPAESVDDMFDGKHWSQILGEIA